METIIKFGKHKKKSRKSIKKNNFVRKILMKKKRIYKLKYKNYNKKYLKIEKKIMRNSKE